MPQLFGRTANTLARVSIVGAGLLAGGVLLCLDQIQKSPYVTEVELIKDQPVPFTHQHHVSGLGIDCRYCHTAVEESASAGIPPTSTCMNCHSQMWSDAPMLAPVREAYKSEKPIPWVYLHDLPEFVYFNHSIHVKKGVGCTTCHGPIGKMPITWKQNTLYMGWCLECHRNPERYVRERSEVFNADYVPPANQASLGKQLVEKHHILKNNVNCSSCHR
jgi:hypothetical protein